MQSTKLNIKKVILCLCLLVLLVYTIMFGWNTLFSSKLNDDANYINTTTNDFSHLSYYQKRLLKRYEAYRLVASDTSIEDIVTHVNMGIDHGFYQDPPTIIDSPNSVNVLVNKFYALPENWEPENLVLVNSNREQSLDSRAAEAFFAFQKACQEEGFTISAYSGYRSTAYQRKIYNNMISVHGQEHTDKYVAKPGQSEHSTGLCVDISIDGIYYEDIEGSPHYPWFVEHLAEYGFILRYPQGKEKLTGYHYESWHIRFLGEELAQEVVDSTLTYDEYVARQ